jgi:hypothetical protein
MERQLPAVRRVRAGLARSCRTFLEAAEGTRTLDLLHGKQTSSARLMRLLPANETIPGLRGPWRIVVFRRVLPGLCQPIVNGRIETRPRSGAAQVSPFRSVDDADEAHRRESGGCSPIWAAAVVRLRRRGIALHVESKSGEQTPRWCACCSSRPPCACSASAPGTCRPGCPGYPTCRSKATGPDAASERAVRRRAPGPARRRPRRPDRDKSRLTR